MRNNFYILASYGVQISPLMHVVLSIYTYSLTCTIPECKLHTYSLYCTRMHVARKTFTDYRQTNDTREKDTWNTEKRRQMHESSNIINVKRSALSFPASWLQAFKDKVWSLFGFVIWILRRTCFMLSHYILHFLFWNVYICRALSMVINKWFCCLF